MVTGPLLMLIFVVSIVIVLVMIIKFKINPFLSLLVVTILTGLMVRMPLPEIAENLASGFGSTLMAIGIVIGLGIVFGQILSECGATQRIAHSILRAVGKENSPLAITFTGYIVSIPVFFDAAFVILISIVRKLSSLTKKSLIALVAALSIGLITSHNLIIPTPGPVDVAFSLGVDMGLFVVYALIAGIPGILVGGWLYGLYLGRKFPKVYEEKNTEGEKDIKLITPEQREVDQLPSNLISFSVLLLPIILILLGSVIDLVMDEGTTIHGIFALIGDKNVALLISVLVAIWVFRKFFSEPVEAKITEAAGKAGMILLITGAGGAYGYVISSSGIGEHLVDTLTGWNVSVLFTGFLLGAILRAALGSSTVALVTASTILGPLALQGVVSPVLLAIAICAGGNCLSLPNDSGFWVVNKFSDFTVKETLIVWTVGGTLAGLVIFVTLVILNLFSGFLPGI